MDSNVSIIVPVYNDPDGIQGTLDSLTKQSASEILVVDNDSTDQTPDIVQSYDDDRIILHHERHIQSSYAARNTGIRHASGDILLFVDADMRLPETWVEDMTTVLTSDDYDYVGCNVEVVTDEQPNFWERYEQSFSFPVREYLQQKHFVPTCALAVRRDVFDSVGLFDERLFSGGDKEFGKRVHRAGFSQGYAKNVTAYHPARHSWKALQSKAIRIGRGRAQIRQHHSDEIDHRSPLHPVSYLPPNPFRLRRRFSDQEVSLSSLVGFYLLAYLLKLVQTYGSFHELYSQR